jgi:hypothetical protein
LQAVVLAMALYIPLRSALSVEYEDDFANRTALGSI